MLKEEDRIFEKLDQIKTIAITISNAFTDVSVELSEARATMLVYFGKGKKAQNKLPELINETMTATQMITTIVEYFINKNND